MGTLSRPACAVVSNGVMGLELAEWSWPQHDKVAIMSRLPQAISQSTSGARPISLASA